jgi:hypothetical protein
VAAQKETANAKIAFFIFFSPFIADGWRDSPRGSPLRAASQELIHGIILDLFSIFMQVILSYQE